MKAQNFIQKHAPELMGSDSIPFHKVLALMESFNDANFHEHFKILHEVDQKTKEIIGNLIQPKPYPNESAQIDAILDEDKMTIDLPNDSNIIDEDLHNDDFPI